MTASRNEDVVETVIVPKCPITVSRRPDGTFVFFLNSHRTTFRAAIDYLKLAATRLTEGERDASVFDQVIDGLEEILSGVYGINAIDIDRTLDD